MTRTGRFFHTFLNVSIGAGAVVVGAYIYSRIKEKQETETRLDKLEQMVEETAKEKEKK